MQNELFGQNGFEALPLEAATVQLWQGWLVTDEAANLYQYFREHLKWSQPHIQLAGKSLLTPRLQCWMGDAHTAYAYSGTRFQPQPWDSQVHALKQKLEMDCGASFNSVLINCYRNGQDSVSWHADDEPELGSAPVIASVSLGASRRFLLRRIARPARERSTTVTLNQGDLLVMSGTTQSHWQHCLPKSATVTEGRINLTFRYVETGK